MFCCGTRYVGLLREESDQSRYMPIILLSELKSWGDITYAVSLSLNIGG